MSEPFDPNTASPPSFPPPGAPGAPMGAPPNVPAYGAPPPVGMPGGQDVPAYGAPPPTGSWGPDPQPAMSSGVLAGFGARLGATLLDGLFIGLATLVLLVPLGLVAANQWETELETCTVDGEAGLCEVPTDDTLALLLILLGVWALLGIIVSVLYYVRTVAKTGQTPGRKIVGIKVVNTTTGEPPSFGMALLRYVFASFISGSLCYLGYLWMLWDAQNQTWHDKVCSTVVVRA